MATIGFIGIGNMGGPMARNLVRAGHEVTVFDLSEEAVQLAVQAGARRAGTVAEAAAGREVVVTMLPAGRHVREVYTGEGGIIAAAAPGALLIDSSTIDVASARVVAEAAAQAGLDMIDAPVSGGVGGADAGTLTFMCGGPVVAFERARSVLEGMGRTIVHAGPAGNGQAAKICNNMILGSTMLAVCEAFTLGERLGLEHQKLFDVVSKSSGSCWSVVNYCPVPGPVPTSPANRDYRPGFATAMMAKDLRLAQEAAQSTGAATPIGAAAAAMYAMFENAGNGGVDFSGVIEVIRGAAAKR